MHARSITPLTLAAVVLALALTAAAAQTARAATAAAPATYTDSTGEDAAAPEITTVAVASDETGVVTFTVNLAARPQLTPDMGFAVLLDTDLNPATGNVEASGAEYLIVYEPGSSSLGFWNGSEFDDQVSQSSLATSYTPAGAAIRIDTRDLGAARSFNFYVVSVAGAGTEAHHVDFAPDLGHGTWRYDVPLAEKATLTAGRLTLTPGRPRAGLALDAELPVTLQRGSVSEPVGADARVACVAAAGARRLAGRGAVVAGTATCEWPVPKAARGKTLRGTVTVTAGGTSVARSFVAKVR